MVARLAVALVLVVLAAACAPTGANSGIGSASPSPSEPAATSSPSDAPSPTLRTVAFPDLPFVVGTDSGDIYTRLANGQPAGAKLHICDAPIIDLVTNDRQVLIACGRAGDTTWYLWDSRGTQVTLVATSKMTSAQFAGADSVVYLAMGRYEQDAPISMGALMLWDRRTRSSTKIDERYNVANDLRLTSEGLAVWRAKINPNGIRTDAEAGTWILRGTSLEKYSQLHLIASIPGLAVLESEPPGWPTNCCSVVYTRTSTEHLLTPADVPEEHALALLDDGRIITWRPDLPGDQGHLVLYKGAVATRVDRALFSTWRVMLSGDWLLSSVPYPNPQILAYRISDGALASVPVTPGAFHSIAVLPPP